MFTSALPRAVKNFPAMPNLSIIPSPTMARMQQSAITSTVCTWPRCISAKKASSTVFLANSACANGTAKQIDCSELACEIMTTETSTARRAPKSLSATPGMPIIPVPSRLSRAIPSI
jgi:hypothetical protein